MLSKLLIPTPKPFFSHSFTTTVFDADLAVKEEQESESVCLLLKNSYSTEMLTPRMARTSQAMQASTGKSVACFYRIDSSALSQINNKKY
jgi:hypothetical protein